MGETRTGKFGQEAWEEEEGMDERQGLVEKENSFIEVGWKKGKSLYKRKEVEGKGLKETKYMEGRVNKFGDGKEV